MRKITILFLIIIVLIIGFIFLTNTSNEESQQDIDNLTDITENRDGDNDTIPEFDYEKFDGSGRMTNNDLTARISVINIWATWCPFCVDELSDFEKLKETYPNDVEIIAINRQESQERIQNYFNNEAISLTDKITFLQDPGDSFARNVGRISMPETLFVSPSGEILFHKRGPLELEEMIDIVNELLG